MPRTKRDSYGRGRGNVNRGSRRTSDRYVLASMEIPNDYSTQQEASDTHRHESNWNPGLGLRHKNINFVSAGAFDQSNLTDPSPALAKMTLVDVTMETHENADQVQEDSSIIQDPVPSEKNELLINMPHEKPDIFAVDTRGDPNLFKNFAPPQTRSPSRTPSASSDEVILFGGRDSAGRGITRSLSAHQTIYDHYSPPIRPIESRPDKQPTLLATKVKKAEDRHAVHENAKQGHSSSRIEKPPRVLYNDATLQPQSRSFVEEIQFSQRKTQTRSHRNAKRDDTKFMIDDYITNLEAQGIDLITLCNQRDLGGTESDTYQDTDASSKGPSKVLPTKGDHLELGTFGAIKPYNNKSETVKAVLSKRKIKAELQYLVVWNGRSMDDTNWVPLSRLIDPRSIRLVQQYEFNKKRLEGQVGSGMYLDENDVNDEDIEASDDDIDTAQGRISHTVEEKNARLLTKQQELEIEPAELLIIGNSADVENYDGELGIPGVPRPVGPGQRKRGNLKTEILATMHSSRAFEAYDAYDGFDIMDFERPSLKKKPKSSRDKFFFDISDSELEFSMQSAKENDRFQKRQRKEKRQDLRTQGLLGQKRAKPAVKNVYQEGMTLENVKTEIRNFLTGDNTTLALPPMDKTDRKVVHEIANAFNINSKSRGNGNKRFPVLYRTRRTTSYSERKFATIEAKLARRYFPRMDVGERSHHWAANRAGRGGFANAAVSYRDGDIVGSSAPELALNNRGRAMLEKMGWSTGTALGADNNKGILQPVSHVVKTTKAGLG